MSDSLCIGLIGLGKIGRVHLGNLKTIPGTRLVAIAETNGLPHGKVPPDVFLTEDWKALVQKDEIDAVVISLPHFLHAEVADFALRQGKHVFLEKPLATTLDEARRLVKRAGEVGRLLMVNMTHRFYPPVQRARELLLSGAIGRIISVRDYYMEIIDRRDFPSWFFDAKMAGGGVVMTNSIHLIDRVAWLLGEPLHFVGGSARRMAPDTAVEDCAEILCQTPSGIPITIGSFFFSGPKTWSDGLTLFGTEGTMTVHAWSHVEWSAYGGKTQREEGYDPSIAPADRPLVGHRAALEEFLNAIRENRLPEASSPSVINAQEIVEAFYHFTDGSLSPGAGNSL